MIQREPTHTALVCTALANADDFLTTEQLVSMGCGTHQRVWQAATYLLQRKAVGVEIQGGVSYWYATPDHDDRSRVVAERKKETTRKRKQPRKDRERDLADRAARN